LTTPPEPPLPEPPLPEPPLPEPLVPEPEPLPALEPPPLWCGRGDDVPEPDDDPEEDDVPEDDGGEYLDGCEPVPLPRDDVPACPAL
jgi:hypothetical protein